MSHDGVAHDGDDLGLRVICDCAGSGAARDLGLRGIWDCAGSAAARDGGCGGTCHSVDVNLVAGVVFEAITVLIISDDVGIRVLCM